MLTFSALVLAGSVFAPAHALPEAPVTQLMVQPSQFHAAHARELGPAAMAPFDDAAGVSLTHVRSLGMRTQVLRLPWPMRPAEARAYAARLVERGVALAAEPDLRVFRSLVPNDPGYVSQWHYQAVSSSNYGINLPPAWDATTGSSSVVVALIDSGLRPHADIDQNITDASGRALPGYDFISDVPTANDGDARDSDPSDPGDWVSATESSTTGGDFEGCVVEDSSWHGTHLGGTLAALSNNGIGVAAIDWNARLLPVRVLGKCGGLQSDVIDGMRWAAGLAVPDAPQNTTPARVLNMSFNGSGACGSALQAAINDVRANKAMVVVAAGNENSNADNYFPGNCSGVINVTATTRQGQRAFYSNYGNAVSIAAPGGDSSDPILSTSNDGTTLPGNDIYAGLIGTSMATAHVSGVVSLMLSENAALTPDDVLAILRDTATAFPSASGCTTSTCGAGIVNAETAVLTASGYVPSTTDGSGSDGGGGALGLLPLAGLVGLALLRRRYLSPTR
ncbi:MAG: S8 family peptidase [Pseudomonadota bacterium]